MKERPLQTQPTSIQADRETVQPIIKDVEIETAFTILLNTLHHTITSSAVEKLLMGGDIDPTTKRLFTELSDTYRAGVFYQDGRSVPITGEYNPASHLYENIRVDLGRQSRVRVRRPGLLQEDQQLQIVADSPPPRKTL